MSLFERLPFLGPHTCPWWFGYTFDNPLRRRIHDPALILGDLVRPGDTVADIGCGLGFFTVALAEMVGARGTVIAVDLQRQMLERTRRRAERRGLDDRIQFHACATDHVGVAGPVDFVLAFWMVHEVQHPTAFLAEVRSMLRPRGQFLIAEPRIHVPAARFARTVESARGAGFEVGAGPAVRFSRAVLCTAP